jgi:hypothetical protein
MKSKKLNDELLDLEGMCNYFNLSESTIRRKVKATREGTANFILPLFSTGRLLWRRIDVEAWRGEDAEVVHFTPSLPPPKPQVEQNLSKVHKELAALGVRLPSQASSESIQ